MEKDEFLKEQFLTLREEIKETKARIFQTMGFGLVIVPGAKALAETVNDNANGVITLPLPILVMVVALVYLSENNALMRCGRYIKLHIEPTVRDVEGWETWLERRGSWDARSVDKLLSYAFYLLFLVYFAGSVLAAVMFASTHFGPTAYSLFLGGYTAAGIAFVIYVSRQIRVSTSTASEEPPARN